MTKQGLTRHLASLLQEHRRLVMAILGDAYLSGYFWQDPCCEKAGKTGQGGWNRAASWYAQLQWSTILEKVVDRIYDDVAGRGPFERTGSWSVISWMPRRRIGISMTCPHSLLSRLMLLGVSNFRIEQLQRLWQEVRIRPRFVQNRCYASLGWDRQVREFCRDHDMVYQGFSLLTANRQILADQQMAQIAARHRRTIPQIVFRFAIQIGMNPLTGTTDSEHVQADLEVLDFRLEPADTAWIEGWDMR